jgi:uncharacterized Zn-finger protein
MFRCDYQGCDKQYFLNYRLKIHKRTHLNDKPFECENCGKKFNEKGNLKIHRRIHTGERPFACQFENCNMRFRTQGHLKDHKKRHENNSKIFPPNLTSDLNFLFNGNINFVNEIQNNNNNNNNNIISKSSFKIPIEADDINNESKSKSTKVEKDGTTCEGPVLSNNFKMDFCEFLLNNHLCLIQEENLYEKWFRENCQGSFVIINPEMANNNNNYPDIKGEYNLDNFFI